MKRVEEGVLSSHRDPSATRFAGGTVGGSARRVARGTLAAVAVLVLAACQQVSAPPRPTATRPTIVSLNPCTDAILAQVAAPGQLLAISHYSHDPASSSMGVAAARHFRSVSGSVEEIAQLSPDVVVADSFLAPATLQALRGIGIRVVTFGSVDSVAASEGQVRDIASAAGNAPAGEQLVARIEQALAAAAPPARSSPLSTIVWESGGIVAGDHTLIADLLRRTGFVNSVAVRGMGQADYLPLEAMLIDPPQVILTTGSAYSQEDRLLAHPALARLEHTRKVPFDSTLLWCGGPTIVRAVDALARLRRELGRAPAGAI